MDNDSELEEFMEVDEAYEDDDVIIEEHVVKEITSNLLDEGTNETNSVHKTDLKVPEPDNSQQSDLKPPSSAMVGDINESHSLNLGSKKLNSGRSQSRSKRSRSHSKRSGSRSRRSRSRSKRSRSRSKRSRSRSKRSKSHSKRSRSRSKRSRSHAKRSGESHSKRSLSRSKRSRSKSRRHKRSRSTTLMENSKSSEANIENSVKIELSLTNTETNDKNVGIKEGNVSSNALGEEAGKDSTAKDSATDAKDENSTEMTKEIDENSSSDKKKKHQSKQKQKESYSRSESSSKKSSRRSKTRKKRKRTCSSSSSSSSSSNSSSRTRSPKLETSLNYSKKRRINSPLSERKRHIGSRFPQDNPPPSTSIIIFGLPLTFGNTELSNLIPSTNNSLSPTSASIIVDKLSGISKGFGFLNYNSEENATNALNFLQSECELEPGSPKEIEKFAAAKQAKFTLFEKCDVKGKNVSPVYAFLKEMSGKKPLWNFTKYLVAKNGVDVSFYPHHTSPTTMAQKIQKLIDEKDEL
ncbi:hypothetical protein ACHWQZ_G008653 [Mnemiopsis leidyi]